MRIKANIFHKRVCTIKYTGICVTLVNKQSYDYSIYTEFIVYTYGRETIYSHFTRLCTEYSQKCCSKCNGMKIFIFFFCVSLSLFLFLSEYTCNIAHLNFLLKFTKCASSILELEKWFFMRKERFLFASEPELCTHESRIKYVAFVHDLYCA